MTKLFAPSPSFIFKKFAIAIVVLLSQLKATSDLNAAVSLPRVFAHNMVFQQDTTVNLWGWADAGETVQISTNWTEGAQTSATAASDGKWKATLVTPPAPSDQTGYTVTFEASNTITLSNVLLGEVWLLSGQSNMELPLAGWPDASPPAPIEGSAEAIAGASFPQIRLMVVGTNAAATPQEDIQPHWTLQTWTACSPNSVAQFSALGYFFGKELHESLNVPIGLLQSAWGGSSCEGWTAADDLQRVANYRDQGPWDLSSGNTPNQIPTLNYNGMIAPIIPFTIAGALWYQGETNMGRAEELSQLFPEMINGWRRKWGQGDFPFYFAHLAPWDQYYQLQLPEFWEAQAAALHLPNTGLAITIELGDPDNIHPPKKEPIGHRMALLARANVYGQTGFEISGPLYRSMEIENDSIRLHFDHTGTGLVAADGGLKAFEIAGANNTFVSVEATIDGNSVIVRSDTIPEPKNVRYAWAGVPEVTLFNSDNLPAAPFRTNPAAYTISNYGITNPFDQTDGEGFFNRNGKTFDSQKQAFAGYGISIELDGDATQLDSLGTVAQLSKGNLLRLIWSANNSDPISEQADMLEQAITRCLAFGTVPLLAFENTGETNLQSATTFWSNLELVALAEKFEKSLIIELASGWTSINASEWESECESAVTALRNAGILNLITIEAPSNDKAATLIANARNVLAADPQSNLLFSLRIASDWTDAVEIEDAFDNISARQIPFIVSRFDWSSTTQAKAVMKASSDRNIGYIASPWNGTRESANQLTATLVSSDYGTHAVATKSSAIQALFNYANWSSQINWQEADNRASADPDLDGINNEFELLLGLNPLSNDAAPSPIASRADSTSPLSYRLGPAANYFSTISLNASNDLEAWGSYSLSYDVRKNQWEWADDAPNSVELNDTLNPDGSHNLSFSETQANPLFTTLDLQIKQ